METPVIENDAVVAPQSEKKPLPERERKKLVTFLNYIPWYKVCVAAKIISLAIFGITLCLMFLAQDESFLAYLIGGFMILSLMQEQAEVYSVLSEIEKDADDLYQHEMLSNGYEKEPEGSDVGVITYEAKQLILDSMRDWQNSEIKQSLACGAMPFIIFVALDYFAVIPDIPLLGVLYASLVGGFVVCFATIAVNLYIQYKQRKAL
tara:strand:+ start:774 stop:1391 length:618 start_codon:yes stop_codon:yes gene_type:complete